MQTIQHYVIAGKTGSGKSYYLNRLLQEFYRKNWRIVLIDVEAKQDSFCRFYEEGTLDRPKLIKNGKLPHKFRVAYYVPQIPAWHDDALENLYDECLSETGIVVAHDEIVGIATENQYPYGLVRLYSQGRKRGVIGIICTQRPVCIPRVCMTQAGIIVAFKTTDSEDAQKLAKRLNLALLTPEMWREPHSYFYYDERKMNQAEYRSPLPATGSKGERVDK